MIARLLDERGEDFNEVFTDFAAHNTVLDYERADSYQEQLDFYVPFYPGEDFRIIGAPAIVNEDGTLQIKTGGFPQRIAYNVIDLSGIEGDELAIIFNGDSAGNFLSPSNFTLELVKKSADQVTYTPIEVTSGTTVDAVIQDLGTRDSMFLVIASLPEDAAAGETFKYQVRAFAPPTFAGGSCSVSQTNTSVAWLFLLGLGILFTRRRSN